MAKQTINIGTTANDGTGTPLRDSFDIVNDNFTEVYAKPNLTLSTNTLTLTKADGSTDTVNLAPYLDGDITSIIAGAGLTGSSLDTGDATLNVVGGDGITVAADEVEATVDDSTIELSASNGSGALRIKDLGVTHAKLENRYTEAVTVSTLTGTYSLDWSAGAVFVMSGSLSGAIEFDFTNFKAGQTIDIYNLTGAQTITFDSNAGTSETFNKCGAVDYDGAATNLIQVQCVDDSATAVFNYAVSAYVSDATPS